MTTPTTTSGGWYADPSGRHEYRYWDGTTWTGQVSDRGVTAIDQAELRSATSSPVAGYRAAAVPTWRIAVVWVAFAVAVVAFLFEALAMVILASGPPDFERWAWLYQNKPGATAYGYPPPGVWIAVFLTMLFPSALLIPPLQAIKKAGGRARWRWSLPAERARLSTALRDLGCSTTLLRGRGRRGLVIATELAALALTGISGYALTAKEGLFRETGTVIGDLSPGLGPKVCLVAGIIAIIAGLVAWPWRNERHVVVFADGTLKEDPMA